MGFIKLKEDTDRLVHSALHRLPCGRQRKDISCPIGQGREEDDPDKNDSSNAERKELLGVFRITPCWHVSWGNMENSEAQVFMLRNWLVLLLMGNIGRYDSVRTG